MTDLTELVENYCKANQDLVVALESLERYGKECTCKDDVKKTIVIGTLEEDTKGSELGVHDYCITCGGFADKAWE